MESELASVCNNPTPHNTTHHPSCPEKLVWQELKVMELINSNNFFMDSPQIKGNDIRVFVNQN